ncbi:hypothetical protein [Paenibacillus sp.]|jgi:hypothetical protein|uniref:hypothetical protein n=1 Tax=Paenibacillus sp. TaxID=58172 RepID=UPI00281CC558|nr:hypothetical protein [Paenibacillus sp.]MDR0268670.1 hypothetical protein [Paenibacillus sp.]
MKQLKSGFLALFSVIFLLGFNISAFAAEDPTAVEESNDNSVVNAATATGGYITHLTPTEAEEYQKNLVFHDSNLIEGTIPGIIPFASTVAVSWNKLAQYDIVSAYETLTVTSKSTINITLVQWPDSLSIIRDPELTYSITGKDYQNSRIITGKYSSSNATIQFLNVPPGEYVLSVFNGSGYTVSGNCYAKRDQGANLTID